MPTIAELKTRREALAASRSSGVARVSYDGKTVDYRSLAEIDRAIEVLDREIATAEGRKILRSGRSCIALTKSRKFRRLTGPSRDCRSRKAGRKR